MRPAGGSPSVRWPVGRSDRPRAGLAASSTNVRPCAAIPRWSMARSRKFCGVAAPGGRLPYYAQENMRHRRRDGLQSALASPVADCTRSHRANQLLTLQLAVLFDQLGLRGDLLTGCLGALPVPW